MSHLLRNWEVLRGLDEDAIRVIGTEELPECADRGNLLYLNAVLAEAYRIFCCFKGRILSGTEYGALPCETDEAVHAFMSASRLWLMDAIRHSCRFEGQPVHTQHAVLSRSRRIPSITLTIIRRTRSGQLIASERLHLRFWPQVSCLHLCLMHHRSSRRRKPDRVY
ncbi:hypothetical protein C8Q73DRAFT_265257 [Cubamyces lactineus]|nr:hypothetical protein C8Q73DRAFT_265257 [Cubamyces lactineus]